MRVADLHFVITFWCYNRYLSVPGSEPKKFELTLNGADGRPNLLEDVDHESGQVEYEPGAVTSWTVPHRLLELLGWSSLEDGPRAAEHWSRLSEVNVHLPPTVPETAAQMMSRVEGECAQQRAEVMRLDAETNAERPVSMVLVDVSALHVPTQKVCHLMNLRHVQRRSRLSQPGRVEFKDERLMLTPSRHGDIHTTLDLRDRVPYVTVALEEPLDDGSLTLSIGIVGRSPHEQQETRIQLRDYVYPHDRSWDEFKAMACLQHALGWNVR